MSKNEKFSWIGQQFVLHSVAFPYTEHEKEVDTFVLVTVVEEKSVRCAWDQTKTEFGLRAEDEIGKSYFNNWEHFDDASSSPRWGWLEKNDVDRLKEWYDICQGIYAPIPFRPVFMDRFKDVLNYCPDHQRLDYTEKNCQAKKQFALSRGFTEDKVPNCFYCLLGKEPINLQTNWKGWR